jgi:predicted lipoprotein with Yx(FWY)xxD motif
MKSYNRRMRRILPFIASIGCAVVLVACGEDSEKPRAASADPEAAGTKESAPPEAAASATARGPLVKLRDSQLGPVLFSGSDRAVYTFTREADSTRNRCRGECAVAWPPFFAKARPRAGRGVKLALLGTVRRGSRRQVTYRGQRLYFYEHDPKRQVLCNDIVEFGGTWFAVTAKGNPPA